MLILHVILKLKSLHVNHQKEKHLFLSPKNFSTLMGDELRKMRDICNRTINRVKTSTESHSESGQQSISITKDLVVDLLRVFARNDPSIMVYCDSPIFLILFVCYGACRAY